MEVTLHFAHPRTCPLSAHQRPGGRSAALCPGPVSADHKCCPPCHVSVAHLLEGGEHIRAHPTKSRMLSGIGPRQASEDLCWGHALGQGDRHLHLIRPIQLLDSGAHTGGENRSLVSGLVSSCRPSLGPSQPSPAPGIRRFPGSGPRSATRCRRICSPPVNGSRWRPLPGAYR